MTNEFVFLVLHGDMGGASVEYVCSTKERADAVADELKKDCYEHEFVSIIQAPVDGLRRISGYDVSGWITWEVYP